MEAPKVEIPKLEAAKIELPRIEAAKIEAPKLEAVTPKAETPKAEAPKYDPPRYDPPKFDPPTSDPLKFDPRKAAAAFRAKPGADTAASAEPARAKTNRFPLLAASVALAAAFGAVLGSLAMAGIAKFAPATPAASAVFTPATTGATRSVAVADPLWKDAIAKVRADVAALKAEVEASNRGVSAYLSKIGDRFDRVERAQAEPATKIARIMETLDRIELRNATAAVAAAPAPTPGVAPDTTGSIAAADPRQPPKAAVVDGWVLRQVFDGFALIEGINGRLFEVAPGSNIPGVGRVETIRRHEGQWVVVTPKGVITR